MSLKIYEGFGRKISKDGKDGKDSKDSKDSKDGKDSRANKDGKNYRYRNRIRLFAKTKAGCDTDTTS